MKKVLLFLVLVASAIAQDQNPQGDRGNPLYNGSLVKYNPDRELVRIIGSAGLIEPQIAVAAKHASFLDGCIVENAIGERAVVVLESGNKEGQEDIYAVLDRPISGAYGLFDSGLFPNGTVTFPKGASYFNIDLKNNFSEYHYIGHGGTFGENIVKVDIAPFNSGQASIYRSKDPELAGLSIKDYPEKTYDITDPVLSWSTLRGFFNGQGGDSGGLTLVNGQAAGIHWYSNSDQYIGDGAAKVKVEALQQIINTRLIDGYLANERASVTKVEDDQKGQVVEIVTTAKNSNVIKYPVNVDFYKRNRLGNTINLDIKTASPSPKIRVAIAYTDPSSTNPNKKAVMNNFFIVPGDGMQDTGTEFLYGVPNLNNGLWHSLSINIEDALKSIKPYVFHSVKSLLFSNIDGRLSDTILTDSSPVNTPAFVKIAPSYIYNNMTGKPVVLTALVDDDGLTDSVDVTWSVANRTMAAGDVKLTPSEDGLSATVELKTTGRALISATTFDGELKHSDKIAVENYPDAPDLDPTPDPDPDPTPDPEPEPLPPNEAPIALDDESFTDVESVIIDVLENDSDPEGDELTIIAVSEGRYGRVEIVNDGVRFTPIVGFCERDTFTYTISDGDRIATASVTVERMTEPGPNPDPDPEPEPEPDLFPIMLDFDDVTTVKTAEGYKSVLISQYDAQKGYGWFPAVTLQDVDTNSSDLRKDHHRANKDNSFLIDVPNGNYEVTMELLYGNNIDIVIEGVKVMDNETFTNENSLKVYTTTVSDGQLAIDFRDNDNNDSNASGANKKYRIAYIEVRKNP